MNRKIDDTFDSNGVPIHYRAFGDGEPMVLVHGSVGKAFRAFAEANGGEMLVSDVVRQLVAGKDFLFSDRGETQLRGFEDPVRVYEVWWEEEG